MSLRLSDFTQKWIQVVARWQLMSSNKAAVAAWSTGFGSQPKTQTALFYAKCTALLETGSNYFSFPMVYSLICSNKLSCVAHAVPHEIGISSAWKPVISRRCAILNKKQTLKDFVLQGLLFCYVYEVNQPYPKEDKGGCEMTRLVIPTRQSWLKTK